MSDGDQRPTQSQWPPPHPSPPLPPPRGSGVPGAPPSLAPYVAGAVAVVVVIALVTVLVLVTGDRGSDEPTSRSTTTPTTSATSSAPAFTCWDGTGAAALEECSVPTGEAGLRWLFPVMEQARCGRASAGGEPGVVTRVLCLHRLADGTRAQLGFFEWASVEQGIAFYDAQGLARAGTAELHTWTGVTGQVAKGALLYVAAPYSITITYPASVTPSPEDQAALAPRPVAELRGVPAQ